MNRIDVKPSRPTDSDAAHRPGAAKWYSLDLDKIAYQTAHDFQQKLVAARKRSDVAGDIVLILEHTPVFTLGRNGGRDNLKVSDDFIDEAGIAVIQAERGGNITFHAPGQLVAYLIVDLEAARLSVRDFIWRLEAVMLQTVDEWGIPANRHPANRGIWVGKNKMGSIGIAIRKGITFHGLALNVDLSLEPFGWINPCGLQGVGVTSMQRESDRPVGMDAVRAVFKSHLQKVFGIDLTPVTWAALEEAMQIGSVSRSPATAKRHKGSSP